MEEEGKLFINACMSSLNNEQLRSIVAFDWKSEPMLVAWLIRPTIDDTEYRGPLIRRDRSGGDYLMTETMQELRYRAILHLRSSSLPGQQLAIRSPHPEHDGTLERGWSLTE